MAAITHINQGMNRVARSLIGALVGAAVVGYFAYYAIQGDRGLLALKQLQGEIERAHQILDQVRSERQYIEQRAHLLRPDNLDADMLDERVRLILNLSHPDDLVVHLRRRDGEADMSTMPAQKGGEAVR
ncbi:MAG TPA: septum formation initiator family protein [Azospirillaceae bacterium]|nr:septum formation initiator family protein [Azospirillaceae bacterium]